MNKEWVNSLPKGNSDIHVHDIYKIYPDWNIDVAAEQQLVEQYDRIVFQFPFYWFNMPPLLKKWMDDVLAYGWCYGPDGNSMVGKEIGVVVSTGGPEAAYQMGAQNKYPVDYYLSFMEGTASFVRSKFIPAHIFYSAPMATEGALKDDFDGYLNYLTKEEINK